MKRVSRSLVLLGLGLIVVAAPLQARRKHHSEPGQQSDNATPAPEPAALPAEAAPTIDPQAPPSVTLGPFVDKHLGKILAPLGESAFAQPEVLASMKASYGDGMAAGPASHKPAYQMAMRVCDAVTDAITERQAAVSALRGALATRSSEAVQPKGGGEAVAKAKADDQFFVDSQKNSWTQHAVALRGNVNGFYLRERELERQIGVWTPPPAPAPAPAPAVAPVPPVAAPAVTPVPAR